MKYAIRFTKNYGTYKQGEYLQDTWNRDNSTGDFEKAKLFSTIKAASKEMEDGAFDGMAEIVEAKLAAGNVVKKCLNF